MESAYAAMKGKSMNQFNGSDINFGAVTTPTEMVAALKQFNGQVGEARSAGILDEEMATDAQQHIAHIIAQVSRPTTSRVFVLGHLTAAVSCVATVSALGVILYGAIPALLKLLS